MKKERKALSKDENVLNNPIYFNLLKVLHLLLNVPQLLLRFVG